MKVRVNYFSSLFVLARIQYVQYSYSALKRDGDGYSKTRKKKKILNNDRIVATAKNFLYTVFVHIMNRISRNLHLFV